MPPRMAARRLSSEQSIVHYPTEAKGLIRRSPFNDEINKNALWGPLYDGRLIISEIHEKFMAGTASLDELRRALKEDYSAEDAKKLVNTWA